MDTGQISDFYGLLCRQISTTSTSKYNISREYPIRSRFSVM